MKHGLTRKKEPRRHGGTEKRRDMGMGDAGMGERGDAGKGKTRKDGIVE